jgi:hypothetical protein
MSVDTSRVSLCGRLHGELTLSHEAHGENFFQGILRVPRLSGVADDLPFMVPGELVAKIPVEEPFGVEGQIRSYRKGGVHGARLQMMVFARTAVSTQSEGRNEAEICGTLLRAPVLRKTPLGREIADVLVTVQRGYGKRDCIPCIAWGRHARALAEVTAGQRMRFLGRMQSRVYQKDLGEGLSEDRITYEISVGEWGEGD